MHFVKALLEQQPMVAMFLTIAIGYLVGKINIKGLSLGAGAVLFVALAVGWFAPKAVPAAMVGTFGLALFLYAVGIQYGKEFFRGLVSSEGRKANLLALIGVLLSAAISLAFVGARVKLGYALGLFAGSGTRAPRTMPRFKRWATTTRQLVIQWLSIRRLRTNLLLYLALMILKPSYASPGGGRRFWKSRSYPSDREDNRGFTKTSPAETGPGVRTITTSRLLQNDPQRTASCSPWAPVKRRWSRQANISVTWPWAPCSVARPGPLRVFASVSGVIGKPIECPRCGGIQYSVMSVRRGDSDLPGQPDLVLEYGDRIALLASRPNFPAVRKFFGDSIKGTAEFSYISIGFGMALGLLVGAIKIPIPGVGKIAIGLAGVLLVALVLGKLRRTGGINWTIPLSANLVLRNLGLTVFLAQVGMAAGPKFVATVAQTGFLFLGLGAVVLMALVLPILLIGLYVFKLPYDQLAGIVAGAAGNPAILAFANKLAPTDKPDIGYAMIFPGMTILKILFVDIVPAFFGR